ncbi:Phenylalanyl-tRNA synthetase beta chain [Desulfurobacterium thermolithotrophum DSM 11699]|uniref:Phenylalanine--tRNA ligase beta subunit n=1 Tax=Desulfurobacterium thermolithotrophum (strain DSM 11699 / BSA) TaxID=868864 RepID=F0S360_DESTD|nr:phenylalanine--tRNA ligase subunit beta [Desulfurobacterium thermolithotrophum]ADY73282.1 Phenylalanyl-tRNA synthetase beta chain [Desulfurobacterium thermolithotrophum DSM 11699]
MRITYNWLKEFINIEDLSAQEIANILTDVGIEVDSVRYAAENLEKVVTGKIVEITKHPNADKLKICQVDVGNEVLQIVTGADNVFEGAVVPVALHGSKLPIGVRIKRSKLRGVVSNGMLCSEEELGLTDSSSSGIMILPDNVEIGKDVKEVLSLDDWIIEYEITTNRPDALSILGIARELKAVLNRPVKLPQNDFKEGNFEAKEEASLSVLDSGACLRYDGFILKGIENKPSPLFMQIRLYLVGLRPINAVVDVTNYVMYELGQPLHAFDLEKLSGREIIVRRAKDGETIVTLDGVERKLTQDDLVIADAEKAVAVAGVMGGEESGTSLSTKNIFLESAHFEPMTIRKTSKRLSLSTDSSYRFERGADIEITEFAARRALHLIQKFCGGKVAKGKLSFYPKPYTPKVIVFNPEKSTKILGVNIPPRKSFEILANLGFTVKKEQNYIVVKVPSWRKYDVAREIDLIEEIVRIYGMKNVISTYPLMHTDVNKNLEYDKLNEVKEFLTAFSLNEAINYSFIGEKLYRFFGLSVENLIKISNPLSEEWVYMRDKIFPSLVQNAVLNINRNEKDVFLFEIAKIFENKGEKLPEEHLHLGILLTGKIPEGILSEREVDFYDLKGIVEGLLELLKLEGKFESLDNVEYLHPGQSAKVIVNEKEIGFIGKLHPDVLERLDIKQDVFVGELSLDRLLEFSKEREIFFKQIPKFPPVTRDIAVLVDADMPVGKLEEVIKSSAKYLEKLKLFDLYKGKGIPEGKKSVAFSLVFRSKEKTLSDEEVNKILNGIIKALEKFGATLRA